jgi:hypothetical protein
VEKRRPFDRAAEDHPTFGRMFHFEAEWLACLKEAAAEVTPRDLGHFNAGFRRGIACRTPPPHTAAMIAWAKRRIAEIGELRRMDMVGFNELDEMRRLEAFVREWEANNG